MQAKDNIIDKALNSLKDGSLSIFSQFFPVKLNSDTSWQRDEHDEDYFIQISICINGDINGIIFYCMPKQTAFILAEKMTDRSALDSLDKISKSAIMELCNMMAGSSCIKMSTLGFSCDISTTRLKMFSPVNSDLNKDSVFYFIKLPEEPEFTIIFSPQTQD
ncbi:chemotaxis protein CheX [Candidatus Riflebacteria bacterium]